ncbi:MAG TPA: peptidyl-tRNA hydrolase [Actinospica sp.]|jgi:peptidyl-tRNA hydrolase|nr:peptidyl-tRNA hydrolase [Actinospica sp.]
MQEETGAAPDESPFRPVGDPRDERPQYVMPLVVRLERDAVPQRTDALETAARAVITLLSDPRATTPEGEWYEAVQAWQDARIRKVVRRARGAEWRRAEALPGITVTGKQAEVRVYPPIPLDAWPKDLARLQVSGTDFGDDAAPEPPEPGVPVVWMNPAVEMTAGKAMAQAGHAAQLGWWRLPPARATEWRDAAFPLNVRTATKEQWATLAASDLPVVRDAGFTEIAPGSATAIAELER